MASCLAAGRRRKICGHRAKCRHAANKGGLRKYLKTRNDGPDRRLGVADGTMPIRHVRLQFLMTACANAAMSPHTP
jgi:hypothetical protein